MGIFHAVSWVLMNPNHYLAGGFFFLYLLILATRYLHSRTPALPVGRREQGPRSARRLVS